MQVATLFLVIIAASVSARADAISITSGDHARTFAYGAMIDHQLYLDRTAGGLAARITFSNFPYADENERRTDESFGFRFPGIRFDSARRTFFAMGGHGELIPIARLRGGFECGSADLAPGAKIYLVKESGRVTTTLTATNYPRGGTRWIEMDNNFTLENLLFGLFGNHRWQPDN